MKILVLRKDSAKGFCLLEGINRPIIPKQVAKLAKSLLKMGCIRPVIVAKCKWLNEDLYYIIDGQHLFHALLRNHMDIPYMIIPINNEVQLIETIALLNASSKSWCMLDYITAWGSINNDYKKLRSIYNQYNLDISVTASILYGLSGASGGSICTKIKSGDFSINDEKDSIDILDKVTQVIDILPAETRKHSRYLCTEYVHFFKEMRTSYVHSKFLKNIEKRKSDFKLVTQEEGKLSNIFKSLI